MNTPRRSPPSARAAAFAALCWSRGKVGDEPRAHTTRHRAAAAVAKKTRADSGGGGRWRRAISGRPCAHAPGHSSVALSAARPRPVGPFFSAVTHTNFFTPKARKCAYVNPAGCTPFFPLSRTIRALEKFQMRRGCHGGCVVRLLRMKHRDRPPDRAHRRPRRSNFRHETAPVEENFRRLNEFFNGVSCGFGFVSLI